MARKMPTSRKINAATNGHKKSALLTAEELAEKLRIPISGLQAEPAKENSNAPARPVHPL
jgi:hypothetical protein